MFSLIIREAWEELQQKQAKERKEFMKPVITPSGEDYLETILVLQKKLGMVRSVDVARHMGVSKPSVCVAVNALKDGGFLTMDEDHYLHLTEVGREVAEPVIAPSSRCLERKTDGILSLASGTFVLLVRLFFYFSGKGAACRAPKGERQIENQLYICKW